MINQMVLSKEIEWIGYEQKTRMLQVEFIAGSVYQYSNVPNTVYHDFMRAPSTDASLRVLLKEITLTEKLDNLRFFLISHNDMRRIYLLA